MKEQLRLVAKLQEVDELLHRLGHALDDLRRDGLSESEIRAITNELEQIAQGQEEVRGHLRRDLLTHYQRFYERHHQNAVARMAGGVCQSCFVAVPSAKALRVRRGETIEFCENCGAILIDEE